jgi:hypothetical protein
MKTLTRIHRLPAHLWAWLNTPPPYDEFTRQYLQALQTEHNRIKQLAKDHP